jgi:hypothetical protein
MGGLIPFPSVPAYPGVPLLTRPIQVAVAQQPILAITLGTVENLLTTALQQAPSWGIFDANGNKLGVLSNDTSSGHGLTATLLSQLTGNNPAVESVLGFDFAREARISSFPIEGGGFASYNKVQLPANPVVTLALEGSLSDRTAFLNLINAACTSTDLFSIVTPEIIYYNYNVTRYTYSRRASQGATLLIVDIYLEEVREVTATFRTVLITAPQDPAATPEDNNGITQPAAPEQSTFLQLTNQAKSLWNSFLTPMFSGGGN